MMHTWGDSLEKNMPLHGKYTIDINSIQSMAWLYCPLHELFMKFTMIIA
jgi:hypothetical protein